MIKLIVIPIILLSILTPLRGADMPEEYVGNPNFDAPALGFSPPPKLGGEYLVSRLGAALGAMNSAYRTLTSRPNRSPNPILSVDYRAKIIQIGYDIRGFCRSGDKLWDIQDTEDYDGRLGLRVWVNARTAAALLVYAAPNTARVEGNQIKAEPAPKPPGPKETAVGELVAQAFQAAFGNDLPGPAPVAAHFVRPVFLAAEISDFAKPGDLVWSVDLFDAQNQLVGVVLADTTKSRFHFLAGPSVSAGEVRTSEPWAQKRDAFKANQPASK